MNCLIEGAIRPPAGPQRAVEAPVSPYAGLTPEKAGKLAEQRVAAALLDVERMQRLAEEQAQREAAAEAIAATARRLTDELASSGAERLWPHSRVREAWFVARYGSSMVPGGPDAYRGVDHAGPPLENAGHAMFLFRLDENRLKQLHRAVRRYEAHAEQAPAGWPSSGWAAFLYAAAAWQHKWPAGTVEGLHQLATRMRAHDQADDPDRLRRAHRGAHERRQAPQAGPISFRPLPDAGGRWPAWFILDANGQPMFNPGHFADGGPACATLRENAREVRVQLGRESVWVDERVQVDREHAFLPPASDPFRRLAERDAFLLVGKSLPPSLDGRRQMRDRDTGAAAPSGYQRPTSVEADVLELVRLDPRHNVKQAARYSPDVLAEELARARAASSRRLAVERGQLMDRLSRGRSES